jgi:hypothetical protein
VIKLFGVANELQDFVDANRWRSCVIGGIALQHWGEPRATRDVDASLFTGVGGEPPVIDVLLGAFPPRIADARGFALAKRVLLLRHPSGVDMDIALAALPYEDELIARAVVRRFAPGHSLRICSAEDLLVLKAFANRPRDRADAETIVQRQKGKLDWGAILERLTPLVELKEEPEILTFVNGLRARWER